MSAERRKIYIFLEKCRGIDKNSQNKAVFFVSVKNLNICKFILTDAQTVAILGLLNYY